MLRWSMSWKIISKVNFFNLLSVYSVNISSLLIFIVLSPKLNLRFFCRLQCRYSCYCKNRKCGLYTESSFDNYCIWWGLSLFVTFFFLACNKSPAMLILWYVGTTISNDLLYSFLFCCLLCRQWLLVETLELNFQLRKFLYCR